MTTSRGLKKRIRARMAETGEAYTTAKRAIEATKPAPRPTLQRFWLSWEERADDYRPIHDPPNAAILGWWCSGSGDGFSTLCALVAAADEPAAQAAVLLDWPSKAAVVWRFCNEVPPDFRPSDRFPIEAGSWSAKRIGA